MEITNETKNKVLEAATNEYRSVGDIATGCGLNYYVVKEVLAYLQVENRVESTIIITPKRQTTKYRRIHDCGANVSVLGVSQ